MLAGKKLKRVLADPRSCYVAALLAIVLTLPALDAGWHLDDYVHRFFLASDYPSVVKTNELDIFRFGDGNPEIRKLLIDYGSLPWWTSENWRASFWRPITAITHLLDYKLWPETPLLMHAHSLLWYGALVLVLGIFYRRLEGVAWAAGLATILYAIDETHGAAVGWLANRNELVATLTGVLALISYLKWKQDGWTPGRWIGPLLFAAALLAKESAVGILAFLISYALILDRSTWRSRVLSLLPYFGVTVVWRIVYRLLGYGVDGMALYTDPLADPIGFATLALTRVPILMIGQWLGRPSELAFFMSPDERLALVAVGGLILLALAVVFLMVLRRDRLAGFWTLAMFLAVLPFAATAPSDRLLFLVGMGAMGLMARFFAKVIDSAKTPRLNMGVKVAAYTVAGFMILIHVVFSPIVLAIRANEPMGPPDVVNRLYYTPDETVDISGKDVVVVNAPSSLHATVSWARLLTDNKPVYERLRILATGTSAVEVRRVDDRSVIVTPSDGFLAGMLDSLYRSDRQPFHPGDVVNLADMKVGILDATDRGQPLKARFTFTAPLGDSSMIWVKYTDGGYTHFDLPQIGESVTTEPIPIIF